MTKPQLFPLVSVDIALFTVHEQVLKVLVLQRANAPGAGRWALPGGLLFPDADKSVDDTALRVLASKTSVSISHLEQVQTFSGRDRDPRGWSLTCLYYALLPSDQISAVAGQKAESVAWDPAHKPRKPLAFDHARLLESAVLRLREKVMQSRLPLHMLPATFTLTQLQHACEAILGRKLDKSAFRRRLKDEAALIEVEGEFQTGRQRPAQLYRACPSFAF